MAENNVGKAELPEQLIVKWRKQAEGLPGLDHRHRSVEQLQECADELEAALRAAAPQPDWCDICNAPQMVTGDGQHHCNYRINQPTAPPVKEVREGQFTDDRKHNFVDRANAVAREICKFLMLPFLDRTWDSRFMWLASRLQGVMFEIDKESREAALAAPPAPPVPPRTVRLSDALNVITYFFDTHKGEILKSEPVNETLCARIRALAAPPPSEQEPGK